MIVGTPHSPAQAFIAFARTFFEAVAADEYGLALGKLDAGANRWDKDKLRRALADVAGNARICSAKGITQSAKPIIEEFQNGDYTLKHRLPLGAKWVEAYAIFRFRRKPATDYFHVDLVAIERGAAQ